MKRYYNELTNVTLTEAEYKELIEREAKEAYEEYLDNLDDNEEAETFETMLQKMFESEVDFYEVDENGKKIEW